MICAAVSTSLSFGHPCTRHTPAQSTVAASIGSTLFFAPCTVTAPESFLPPSTKMTLIFLPRFHRMYAILCPRGPDGYFTSSITVL